MPNNDAVKNLSKEGKKKFNKNMDMIEKVKKVGVQEQNYSTNERKSFNPYSLEAPKTSIQSRLANSSNIVRF